jgi:hypothetical protein
MVIFTKNHLNRVFAKSPASQESRRDGSGMQQLQGDRALAELGIYFFDGVDDSSLV